GSSDPAAQVKPQESPMTVTAADPKKVRASWKTRALRGLLASLLSLLVVWTTLAVYYSNLPWAWLRLVSAVAVAAFSVWALWLSRLPRMRWAFAGLFVFVLVWFLSIRPSHDRPWQPQVAIMPRAIIDGDRVRITGYRNFDYRTTDDFTQRWE